MDFDSLFFLYKEVIGAKYSEAKELELSKYSQDLLAKRIKEFPYFTEAEWREFLKYCVANLPYRKLITIGGTFSETSINRFFKEGQTNTKKQSELQNVYGITSNLAKVDWGVDKKYIEELKSKQKSLEDLFYVCRTRGLKYDTTSEVCLKCDLKVYCINEK